ncbi:MAG: serine--tRNA ligase [Candidatus Aenigmatarchaeota archaeon]
MLDINLIRENSNLVKKNLKRRGSSEKISLLKDIKKSDEKWRKQLENLNDLKHEKNLKSEKIAELKREGKQASNEINEMKKLSQKIESLERDVRKLKTERDSKLKKIPNLLHEDVPKGKDENDNVEIKRWGKEPSFDFEPRSHLEILEDLDMIDLESGAKTAGSDFYYLKGDVVMLDLALQRFAIDFLRERDFRIIEPPYMVNEKIYKSMIGDIENLSESSYKVEDKNLWLIPTSEFPIGGMFSEETLVENDLPKKICAFSPCFRREVGTHGKYSKGLYRVHQFNKVEQFIFSKPEKSWEYFKELQENAEELYRKLGLYHRVVNACTGDISSKASMLYDIECWMADGNFHETGSNSNCLDYQARNLNLKYREEEGKPPKGYLHTLNNTAIATSRTMIAIIEQFQQKDGTVKIPEVLRPYMNGIKKLE